MKRPRGPIAKRRRSLLGRVGEFEAEIWYDPRRFAQVVCAWVHVRGDRRIPCVDAVGGGYVPKLPGVVPTDDIPCAPRKRSNALKAFKSVDEYLADTTWPGGVVMGEVQLSLRTRNGRIVAQLKLQDHGGLRLSVEGAHVDDALAALEAALACDPTPWERDPYPLGATQGKKKK